MWKFNKQVSEFFGDLSNREFWRLAQSWVHLEALATHSRLTSRENAQK